MRALSFSSPSWFGLALVTTAISAMGCGSSVAIEDAKGTTTNGATGTTSTTGAGGTGQGGSTTGVGGTSTWTTGGGGSVSTWTETSTVSSGTTTGWSTSTTWASACDEVCAKVENECNQGDLCGQYGLDCGDPQYECASSCVASSDCDEIQLLLEAVGTQDWQALMKLSPATQSCLKDCYSTGTGTSTGSTGTGSTWTGTGTGTGDPKACGQCGYQSCQIPDCGQDAACKPWRQCTMQCGNKTPECYADCNAQFPGAASKYDPFYACMCTSCDSECGATMDPCNQGGPGGGTGGAGGSSGTGSGVGGAASSSTN